MVPGPFLHQEPLFPTLRFRPKMAPAALAIMCTCQEESQQRDKECVLASPNRSYQRLHLVLPVESHVLALHDQG